MTSEPFQINRDRRGPGVALVGYRGTGKSTVGRLLADRLNRRFFDVDAEIEARAGESIASIFATAGEPCFRDWEARTLEELVSGFPDAVLATGGGIVLRESNRRLLGRFGVTIWLKADPAELERRLQADSRAVASRPALTAAGTLAEIAEVLERREPLYREAADLVIETQGHSPDEVAAMIGRLLFS